MGWGWGLPKTKQKEKKTKQNANNNNKKQEKNNNNNNLDRFTNMKRRIITNNLCTQADEWVAADKNTVEPLMTDQPNEKSLCF